MNASSTPRRPATVSSGNRGVPLADLVERLEQKHPGIKLGRGLSSAELRAADAATKIRDEARRTSPHPE